MKQTKKPARASSRAPINFRAWPYRGILDKISKETGLSVAAISLAHRAGTNAHVVALIDMLVAERKKEYERVVSRVAA